MDVSASTVLITGAHGFIGRHVARAFAAAGARVAGVGRQEWSHGEAQSWGVSSWHVAPLTVSGLSDLSLTPDTIVHCAGGSYVGQSQAHPLDDFEATVGTTAAVLEFARRHAPQARVVLPSSAAVYGRAEVLPITEEAATRPVSIYGHHKLLAEQLCHGWGLQFGIRSVLLRIFSVYGPGLRKQLLWDACQRLTRGERTFGGTGAETRDLAHVSDIADLLVRAAGHASPEAPLFNVGTGTSVSTRQILQGVLNALGLPGEPAFTGVSRPGDPQHYRADISRVSSWGWAPTRSLESGLAEYVEWFKNGAP
jgi:UDP-glucose 4-epimerase